MFTFLDICVENFPKYLEHLSYFFIIVYYISSHFFYILYKFSSSVFQDILNIIHTCLYKKMRSFSSRLKYTAQPFVNTFLLLLSLAMMSNDGCCWWLLWQCLIICAIDRNLLINANKTHIFFYYLRKILQLSR